uniref:MetA-pathway of phenol degradation n=1 Tax=Candidatus Kentrum sp. TUN TaxID=2126343 RepID=A0A450ZHV1_9GAMM|nr:MAG: hypothetical protein BECKTUN1418F_GA0071002_101312 [Candidatus Kentron sp. TUN]VFK53349.1 MAG: hypothetical protein BECKTUN1418E_GA0071001_101512 [Candidatus Kentron sp. TUN]
MRYTNSFYYVLLFLLAFPLLAEDEVIVASENEDSLPAHRLSMRDEITTLKKRSWRMGLNFSYSIDEEHRIASAISNLALANLKISLGLGSDTEIFGSMSYGYRSVETSLGENVSDDSWSGLGTLRLGLKRTLRLEDATLPQFVASASVSLPMSDEAKKGGFANENWIGTIGLIAVKSIPPGFLIGGISYSDGLEENDASIGFQAGIGFAITHDLSLRFGVAGNKGLNGTEIASSGISSAFTTSVTYRIDEKITVEPYISIGMTEAQDATFGLSTILEF